MGAYYKAILCSFSLKISTKSVFWAFQKMDQLALALKDLCTLGEKLHYLFSISVDL